MKIRAIPYILLSFFLISCGESSNNSSSSAEESEKDSDKTISGVAQLGPFEKGSTISAYELDEDLKQTNFNIESSVLNDQGEYSINLKDLESQYALLKADGYYRNAITGEKTREKATLYALTDLNERSEANINILTHLSHKRAIYLAKEENMSVAEAKKQAETEVLKSFGINEEFDDAENLNIIGKDNQSIALLVISILMQSDIAETELKERLTNYATDIEEDGTWDDKATIAKIADWAYKVYYYSAFGTIKDYVKTWNSSAVFAIFEKYANAFWHHHYGLGICYDDRINEVLKNELFTSDFQDKYFICRPGGKWKEASTSEFLKYFKIDENATDGMERSVQTSTNKMECQVYEDGEWRKGNNSDCNLGFGGCTKKREGMTATKTTYNAIDQWTCKNQEWTSTSKKIMYNDSVFIEPIKFDLDTIGWKDTTDGAIRKGNFSDVIYIFDKDAWRLANLPEASLGKCSKDDLDSAGYAEFRDGQTQLNPLSFACNYNMQLKHTYDNCPGSTFQSGYYKCSLTVIDDSREKIYGWSYVSSRCVFDKYDLIDEKLIQWKDGKEGEIRWGNLWDYECKQNCYKFHDGEWNSVSITQCLGLGECNQKLIGSVQEGPTISTSRTCYRDDADFHVCEKNLVKVDSLQKKNYVCRGDYDTYDNDSYEASILGSGWSRYYWDIANDIDMEMSQERCTQDGALVHGKKDSKKIYVCDDEGFREATDKEKQIGLGCTYFTSGKKVFLEDSTSYYYCQSETKYIRDLYYYTYTWEIDVSD